MGGSEAGWGLAKRDTLAGCRGERKSKVSVLKPQSQSLPLVFRRKSLLVLQSVKRQVVLGGEEEAALGSGGARISATGAVGLTMLGLLSTYYAVT